MPDDALITFDKSVCRECWGCVRHCPARAIRVADGCSEIIDEKCVRCGVCVSECGRGGRAVRDDRGLVRDLLASERKVVAVLATELVAALYPMPPTEIDGRLITMGFYAVESTLLGEELVAIAYEKRHTGASGVPVIRSTCPVVNEWVRRFRPALAGALVPIVPPYVAQARLVKQLYPEGTAVMYVSPCYARKDEWRDPEFDGALDAVIDFTELKSLLEERATSDLASAIDPDRHRPEPLKEMSLTDGYPRATLMSRNMTSSDVQVVRGLRALDRLLEAIEVGEAAPLIIDALNCEGCIDGPAVNPGMSLFAKRNVDAFERESRMRPVVSSRKLLDHLPGVDLVRSFHTAAVVMREPTAEEIDLILAEGEFTSRLDTIDCGACGYATCVEQATAVFAGASSWEMCFPLQRRRLERNAAVLAECATLDSLTALWNRRVFSERLAEEMARHMRYGTPVALLMMDLDGFKQINDEHGHVAGDSVLAAVAGLLRECLRTTDLPARYGDDEFAVILPGVAKTDAYAVAEKLRAAIAELRVDLGTNGDKADVRVSIGVAAAVTGKGDRLELVEAADRAMYRAKAAGKDQVRLAPG